MANQETDDIKKNLGLLGKSESYADVAVAAQSDTVDLPWPCRAIRATAAGNIKVDTVAGNSVVCAFVAGETRRIMATRIWVTGTTATGIEVMR